ncbi:MAG: hypothetical protein ACSHXF_11955 [Aquaticitalea sp.]
MISWFYRGFKRFFVIGFGNVSVTFGNVSAILYNVSVGFVKVSAAVCNVSVGFGTVAAALCYVSMGFWNVSTGFGCVSGADWNVSRGFGEMGTGYGRMGMGFGDFVYRVWGCWGEMVLCMGRCVSRLEPLKVRNCVGKFDRIFQVWTDQAMAYCVGNWHFIFLM